MPGARHPQAATAGDIRSRRSQGRRADHRRQIIDTDQRAVTQCNQGTQHRAQLPHIARPGERQQCLTRAGIERYRLLPGFLGQQKIQQLRLITALAQRRQADFEAIESVVQIFTKAAGLHTLQQITVGGADDSHVYRLGLAADGHHQAILQHPQEPGLQSQGMSPISSRNNVPPSACCSLPRMPSLRAPVKLPPR